MYIHKSLTLCIDIYLCHPTPTYDGHPKFRNETISRKARQFWQPNGKIHLFVNTRCTHAYHSYAYTFSHGLPAKYAKDMHLTVNSKSNLTLFTSLGFVCIHDRMAEEASKLRGLEARVAALETKFNFLLQFMRRMTEQMEERKKAMISKRREEIYPALSLSKAAQTLPTPRRPAFHIPRPSQTEPRQF
jgi:hypothetical protein